MIRLGSLIPKHQGRVRKDKEAAAGSGGSQQSAGGSEKKDHSKSKGARRVLSFLSVPLRLRVGVAEGSQRAEVDQRSLARVPPALTSLPRAQWCSVVPADLPAAA